MIGKTNIPMGMSKGETVSILLKTNQSSNDDLNGVNVVVSYDDESHEYTYNGQFSVEIPKDKTYTVAFGEVDGYKTPLSVTYTAVKGFSRSVEVTYSSEFLTLNVTGTSTPVVTIKKVKEVGVSEKYKVVDYVETNGTQYIDTGFNPNNNTRVVMDMQAFEVSENGWAFGGRDSTSKNSMGVFYYYSSNKLWNADYSGSSQRKSFSGIGATDRIVIDYNKNICSINGVSNTFTATTFQSSYPMVLFAVNTANTVSTFIKAKLYSCKIYDNDILVRDYIPVLRSDGVAGLYDAVNDTFSSSTGSLASGSYISDETIATQTSVSGLHKIAYDTEYMIEGSAVEGFTTPEVQYYTANQPSRNVSVDYLLAEERVTVNVSAEDGASVDSNTVSVHTGINGLGVYIQDINGRLWNESEWDNSTTPNGIAVITHECQFVIALEDAESGKWLESSVILDDLPSLDATSAQQDYNGVNNTNVLLSSEISSPAAINCNNYTFPDGSKGYLGAAGEWQAVIDNEAKITSALSLCGGKGFTRGTYGVYYWTSTQQAKESAYMASSVYPSYILSKITYNNKSGTLNVRVFKSIGSIEKHPITNGKASFGVPYDETYTVSLSDMDGYMTPESQTYTASQPTREISMEYKKAVEHVIVYVIDENDAFANRQVLTVSGGVTGSYTINNSKVEFDVPEGLTYTVSVDDKDGYITPESQTFTAGTGTREIDMVYEEIKLGVFIQGVSGKLYETDDWTGQETPNGVAVLTEECSFVIALTETSSKKINSTGSIALENYMTAIPNETQAKADYDGATNTTNIMKLQSSTSYAAGWCNAFSFPSGKKGFLPSLGQMWASYRNKAAVDTALTKAGGTAFTSAFYWTSTF